MARLSERQAANDEFSVALRILHLSTNPEILLIYTFVPEINISVINRYDILLLIFVYDPVASFLRQLVTATSHTM